MGSGFKEFGIAAGDALKRLKKYLVVLMAFVVKLIADLRRRIRRPKIKYKFVEKEVEVEKIVEVEVEKIVEVEKEVEKIVEVDKVVFKEVPKEIVRKEIVYVPLYSTENGTLNTDSVIPKPDQKKEDDS